MTSQTIIQSILVFLALLAPVWLAIVIVILVVLLDTFTAMLSKHLVAKRDNKPSPITSRKFGMIIIKLILYCIAILTGFVLDVFLIDVLLNIPGSIEWFITKVITIVIVSVETLSIDESIRNMNNNKGIAYYLNTFIKAAIKFKSKIAELIKRV